MSLIALSTVNPNSCIFRNSRDQQSQKTLKVKPFTPLDEPQELSVMASASRDEKTPIVAQKILNPENENLSLLKTLWRAVVRAFAAVCCGGNRKIDVVSNRAVELGKLIEGTYIEEGVLKPEELLGFTRRTQDETLRAFSSFNRNIVYPYEVAGVEKKEDKFYTESLFEHFAEQSVGSHDFVESLKGIHGVELQKSARQTCAFLKVLGDKNIAYPDDMNWKVVNQNVFINPTPEKPGRLTTLKMGYSVKEDIVGIYAGEDLVRPQAECTPVARFKASRTVSVSAPDQDGNVAYTIRRELKPIV